MMSIWWVKSVKFSWILAQGMEELVEKYRENLIEKAAEQDEEVLEAYLETGEAPDTETLKKCIRNWHGFADLLAVFVWLFQCLHWHFLSLLDPARMGNQVGRCFLWPGWSDQQVQGKGTLSFSFVPVLCGTAFKNKGVQPLLDAVCDYLPSPLDLPPTKGKNPKNEEEELVRETSPDEKLSGLAFKVAADPYIGTLTFYRIYSGKVKAGDMVWNPRSPCPDMASKRWPTGSFFCRAIAQYDIYSGRLCLSTCLLDKCS